MMAQDYEGEHPVIHLRDGDKWSENRQECDYTGNESRSWDDHSIYFHYAMVVLPKEPLNENTQDTEVLT